MAEQILLVDDEPSLRASLSYSLGRAGFRVTTAADGSSAIAHVRRDPPDLVLLDVMLPGLDGFEVCRRMRSHTQAPVVMLTARDDPVDRVVGLEVGADDYVAKPFSLRELIARVRAQLRRAAIVRAGAVERPSAVREELVVGGLRIDLDGRRASLDGRALPLRRREFDLLAYMARNAGVVLTRSQLLANVWSDELDGGTRTVDVHVRRLRRHLEPSPDAPVYLHTARGTGYQLKPPGTRRAT
ncbi:MAG TPA: response regulator transcription factor [Chloroflexota bacterium]|nr:response regulator transcription factor [Chloroflexota bacterium]